MELHGEDLLDLLDYNGAEALFSQREQNFKRISFEMERQLYRFVYEGKPDEMIAFYRNFIAQTPDFRLSVGQTSMNNLRQMKYAAVSAVALACRVAMLGGAMESVAYGKSDDTILLIDKAGSIPAVLLIEQRALIEYAQLVQKQKQHVSYSSEVRACIEYIAAHTHGVISLDELAQCTAYSKEYLAKLFRKETGITLRDYIFQTRIDEAKALLSKGKSCGQVAYLMGFSSQSHFINRFKKATGYTPRFYSSLHRELANDPSDPQTP